MFLTKDEAVCLRKALRVFDDHVEQVAHMPNIELACETARGLKEKIDAVLRGKQTAFDANDKVLLFHSVLALNLVSTPTRVSKGVLRKLARFLPEEKERGVS